MNNFAITNINIDFDAIQDRWFQKERSYLSKSDIKRAVYDFVYGQLGADHLAALAVENVQIVVNWHFGWDAPVVRVPSAQDWFSMKHNLTYDLAA